MWGNRYSWELKISQQQAFRHLLQAAGKRTYPSLNRPAPGPDDGAITGTIGPEAFCLTFLPLRSPNDFDTQKAYDESQLEPVGTIEIVETGPTFERRWFGPQIAFVGTIRATPTGCIVSGGMRPRWFMALLPVLAVVVMWPLTSFIFARLGWPAYVAMGLVAVLSYWINAVLASGSRSGVGVLRFLDRAWKAFLI